MEPEVCHVWFLQVRTGVNVSLHGVNCVSDTAHPNTSLRLDHAHRLRPPSLRRDFQTNWRRILLSDKFRSHFFSACMLKWKAAGLWRRQGHWLMRAIKISVNQLGEQFVHLGAVIAVLLWSFHNQTLLNIIVTSYIRCGNYQSPIQFCQFPKPVLSAGWDRGRLSGSTVVHDKRRWKLHRQSANCSNLTPSIYQGEFVKNHVESTSIFLIRKVQINWGVVMEDVQISQLTVQIWSTHSSCSPVWTHKHSILTNIFMIWHIHSSAHSPQQASSCWSSTPFLISVPSY